MHAQTPFFQTFDPDYDAAYEAVAQADTVDDALAMMQTPPSGGSVSKQIIAEMAVDPAMAMANIALQRREETHEAGIAIVFPVLKALGFHEDDLRPHLVEAQKLFAQGVADGQKNLDVILASDGPDDPQAAAAALPATACPDVLRHARAL